MEIRINGESRVYAGRAVLGDLLRSIGVNPQSVAVERNMKIVTRSEIELEPVEPGDSFEIIRMVGGG
jgi:thiazole synthase